MLKHNRIISKNESSLTELYNMHHVLFLKYKQDNSIVLIDTIIHTCILIVSLTLMYCFRYSMIISIVTVPILSLLMFRSIIIFHDCVHGSYSNNDNINYILSFYYGLFACLNVNWKFIHKTHHLTNGHIDNPYQFHFNETTVHISFYKNLSPLQRQIYKLWKPFSFGCTIIEIGIIQRFSIYVLMLNSYMSKSKLITTIPLWKIIINDILSNFLLFKWLSIVHSHGILYHYIASLVIYGLITIMAFHNQHTFNPVFVEREKWTYRQSAINGSSIINVPWMFKYFSSNIEYHHLHHLNSKIPSYHLRDYHDDVMNQSDEFDEVVRLSMKQCFENLSLVLYSEQQKKYLTFPEADKEIFDDCAKKLSSTNQKNILRLKKPAKYLKKISVI